MGTRDPNELVAAYADLVTRVAYTYLRSTADAEDVCQEVLIKLLRREEPFESEEHERAWVVRVTANTCKNILRQRSAHTLVPLDNTPEPEALPAISEQDLQGRADGVLAAVERLPLGLREAVFLRYYEGYSIHKVADALGISDDAATKRLSRARIQLKNMLKEAGHDFDV